MEAQRELIRKALAGAAGFEARPSFSLRGARIYENGPQSTAVNVPMYLLRCDGGTVKADREYANEATIMANSVWTMAADSTRNIGGKRTRLLGSPIGRIRGHLAFEPESSGGLVWSYEWVVLVTRPGHFPFRYITREEMLEHVRALNEKRRQAALDMLDAQPVRPQAVQAAEKEKELAGFLKSARNEEMRRKFRERFEKDYRTDEQKRAESKAKMNRIHDKIRARLDAVAARFSPEELRKPAFMAKWNVNAFPDEDFDFAPPKHERCNAELCDLAGDSDGKPLAVLTRSYFDKSLPSATPQFFTVSFRWSGTKRNPEPRDVPMEKVRDEFFARFDFDALVALLGK